MIDIPQQRLIILAEPRNFEMYKDYAVCANGAMYRKDVRGFLPELMDKMYGDRVIFKKKMIQALRNSMKLHLLRSLRKRLLAATISRWRKRYHSTSAYGAIGNQYFRYYQTRANAEAITLVRSSLYPLD